MESGAAAEGEGTTGAAGVYITPSIVKLRVWRHEGVSSMLRACKVLSPECRARFQEIVHNEAAQTETAGPSDANAETSGQAAGGSAPSSSSGPAPVAGSPAREDANMEVVAESSAAQSASSAAWTLEAEDQSSAKRQRVLAGMPTLHESDEEVTVDAYKNIVLAAMPDDREDSAGHRLGKEIPWSQERNPA